MFKLIPKLLFTGLTFLSTLTFVNSLKCVSKNNQECKIRPEIVNVKSDKPIFYPYSAQISKYSGSCNSINDPYEKLCVPDVPVPDAHYGITNFHNISSYPTLENVLFGAVKIQNVDTDKYIFWLWNRI